MKTTKILLTAIALLVISATTVRAQDGRLSFGLELGMPMGDFGDGFGMGLGGSVRYEMPMGDNLGLMFTAGYLSFAGKTPDGAPDDYDAQGTSMIPLQVGAKYYFQEQQNGFYGALELGVHMSSYTIPGTDPIVVNGVTVYAGTEETTETNTNFSYAPGVGYHLANLDLGLKYQMVSGDESTSSYLGLRIAYVLGGN